MKKRISLLFIAILITVSFVIPTPIYATTNSATSEQNLINYANSSRIVNISAARSTISANTTVISFANQLTTGEGALKILGKSLFGIPTALISPKQWLSFGKDLVEDIDLWIMTNGLILANLSCASSNENAQAVLNLYTKNPAVKDYITAKKIFDLMKQSQIDGDSGRALVMPIVNKYAALEPKYGAYKALTMVFLQSSADSSIAMFGGNIKEIKKVADIYSKTNNSMTMISALKDLSGYGAAVQKASSDWNKLFNTITEIPKVDNNKIADGVYTIESRQFGNLNVYAGKDKDGTNVCVWQKDNSKEQKFRVVSVGSNKYKLYVTSSNNGYGRVLDVNRGTSYSAPLKFGLNIDIWNPNDAPAQEWYITSLNNGFYKIELAALKDGVIESKGSRNNSNVSLQNYNGSNAQQWKFVK